MAPKSPVGGAVDGPSAGFGPKREPEGGGVAAGFGPKRPVAGLEDSAGFAPNRPDPPAAGVADEDDGGFSAGFDENIPPVDEAGAAPPKRGLGAGVPVPVPVPAPAPNKPDEPVAGCEGGGPAGVVENDSGDGLLVEGVVDPLFNAPPNIPPLEGG